MELYIHIHDIYLKVGLKLRSPEAQLRYKLEHWTQGCCSVIFSNILNQIKLINLDSLINLKFQRSLDKNISKQWKQLLLILSSFTQAHIVPNLHDWLSATEHTKNTFWSIMFSTVFVNSMKVIGANRSPQ